MNYRNRPVRTSANTRKDIQWHTTFCYSMDSLTITDQNENMDEQQTQPRTFYNGQETSLRNVQDAADYRSFPSFSGQRSRGRKGWRRAMSAPQRGRYRTSGRKQRNNPKSTMRHKASQNESDSESIISCEDNAHLSDESVNIPDSEVPDMKCHSSFSNYEFLPNSMNVNQQRSDASMEVHSIPVTENTVSGEGCSSNDSYDKFYQWKKAKDEFFSLSKYVKPSEIIMDYRQQIEKLSNTSTAQNLEKIDRISLMILKEKTFASILNLHYQNLILQQKAFDAYVAKMKPELNSIQYNSTEDIVSKADNIKLRIENECILFQRTLPAYAYKNDILDNLKDNQVVIISADCSYFFNVVTPLIVQSELSGYSVISCESNSMSRELLKKETESIIKNNLTCSPQINYVTENKMLNCLSGDKLSTKKIVSIVNLSLKRSITCDILLASLRDLLSEEKCSRLILLVSAFDNVQKYQKYFSKLKVFVLEVPRLLLPVKTVWRKESLTNFKSYKDDIVCTALSVHILNEPGDVLVFLPNEAEAKTAVAMLNSKLQELSYDNVKCILLHENYSDISNFKMQVNSEVRTVFFGASCAEVMPILSVRYVIDCGLKRDYIYDSVQNLDVLTTVFSSRAKARLRKSLVGVYSTGICYRIYSKEDFCINLSSSERPDILSLNPFNTLIKIFHHAPENALSMQFVEPLNDVLKYNTVKLLKNFNALKNGELTQLGKNMVKLPFSARYSKLILQGINWGYAYEAVIFVAYFSVDSYFFYYSKNEEYQREIDAAKLQMIQHESDPLTFLSVFRSWVENNFSSSWCKEHHIDCDALNEVKVKVADICQQISDCLNENIVQEFSEIEDLVLLEMLFNCFGDHLCVFSGHYRSGYKILSSRRTAFIHPSSVLNSKENLPQLIIFNKVVQSSRNFLRGITSVPTEMVLRALTDKTLEFDYSDVFERTLVPKVIEPVSEKIIKQILLGKKGKKLQEIENYIKETLKIESFVIEPSVEKGSISVFAVSSVLDSAVQMVEEVLKSNLDNVINAEQVHVLKLKKGEVKIPLEVKCVKGGIITSVKVVNSSDEILLMKNYGNSISRESMKNVGSAVQYSINLTWTRRPCNGICYVDFSPSSFMQARRLATRKFLLLDSDIYIEVSNRAENQLHFSDIPPEARSTDIEKALKSYLPGVEIIKIEQKFMPPFETTERDLEQIKIEIQENCEECTNLVDFEVIVPKPKHTATLMTAYINVFDTDDLTSAAENLSNTLINEFKVNAIPVYRSIIKSSFSVYNALEFRIKEEMQNLQSELSKLFPNRDLFRFQVEMVDQDLVRLKLLSNDIRIMKHLQRTVNELLEGEVLNKNAVNDIHKLFCHGGHMWLRTLEKSKNVYILEDYNSKIIRVYGSQQNCFQVKESILNFLEDTENEGVESIILSSDKSNRMLLKAIIKEYSVSLESFVELCKLRSAVLDIKSCRLLLHGSRDSIDKAKEVLSELSNALDTTEEYSLLSCGETCPVCSCPAFNLTFRLQHCGHLYCNECILGLVEQAEFPIQCCAEDCSEDIVLDDIIRILEDEEKIKKLLHSSLNDFLERNRTEIVYCPAPDCTMFFYKSEVCGKVKCPLCQNEICISCNVIYHHGFTCELYQGSRKDPDYSFKVWKKNVSECKACPRCSTAIEKNAGCDHMTCASCKAHFCWICLREFPSDKEVYSHIPFCDKYPKW